MKKNEFLIVLIMILACSITGCFNKEKQMYTVYFITNGGTSLEPIRNVSYDTLINEPNTPTKEGNTFVGWYKEATLTTEWNFSKDKIISNTILYAKWTLNNFNVTFNCNGGSAIGKIENVIYGSALPIYPVPVKQDYVFLGWFKDYLCTEEWIMKTDIVEKDIMLHAKWDKFELGYVFVSSGSISSQNIKIDLNYYMSKFEVTQAEFYRIMGFNPAYFKELENNPIENITWYDAVMYCNKLSISEGIEPYYIISDIVYSGGTNKLSSISYAYVTEVKSGNGLNGYRLPKKQEWEYAARGGNCSKGYQHSGSDFIDSITINGYGKTQKVGGKAPNELGIYDMTGNVEEFTGTVEITDRVRVIGLGGSWEDNFAYSTFSSFRWYPQEYRKRTLGFRVVQTQ